MKKLLLVTAAVLALCGPGVAGSATIPKEFVGTWCSVSEADYYERGTKDKCPDFGLLLISVERITPVAQIMEHIC
jgi:hypothetical protein